MTRDVNTEIRLAMFGQSAAGKTTLLASYFGNQQRHAFEERHGFRLQAQETSDGNQLLGRYYGMEQGRFPHGSDEFREHRFAVMLRMPEKSERAFGVVWYDYPGGWWERTPSDVGEQEARREALEKLVTSHVGILLLDGAKYVSEGMPYVRNLLDHFKNEIHRLAPSSPNDELPRQWIIAVSKADLLPPGTTAEAVCKDLLTNASDQLHGLAKALPSHTSFGRHFLLLSAARGDGARVMDAHSYIGLTLVAPLALSALMSDVLVSADAGQQYGWLRTLLEKLREVVAIVDKLDDLLPRKYQVLTHLLRILSADDALVKGTEYFATKQEAAARKGDALKAAVYAMQRELASDEAQGVYYESRS